MANNITISNSSANLSFLTGFTSTLGGGQKSTISNIALSVSRQINDSFQASQASASDAMLRQAAKRMQLAANQSSLGSAAGRLNAGEPLQIASPQPLTVVEYREEEPGASNQTVRSGDAGFSVDASVDGADSSSQTEINLRQAAQIKQQMRLGADDGSLESLARDLAVLGLDFTAMKDSPESLVETVRQRSLGLLDKLSDGDAGLRNQITGASARLVNGIQSAAGVFFSVDSSNNVSVGGTTINGKAAYVVGSVVVDPIVLDLGGNGIDLSGAEEGVEFDMDGDGEKSKMTFIRGDDALLFVDTHGDGTVHDGTQLFGNTDGHANGFDKLRSYDGNNDGMIDANDEIWDSLRVWVEKTADGVSEASETMTLEEAGVQSISVGYRDVREDDGKGNLIGQIGTYQRADGSAGLAADAWFQNLGPAR